MFYKITFRSGVAFFKSSDFVEWKKVNNIPRVYSSQLRMQQLQVWIDEQRVNDNLLVWKIIDWEMVENL